MAGQGPSPQTTLLILLGASSWPRSELGGSTAFENAVRDLQAYFLSDPYGFHLPRSHALDLFNSDDSGPDILDRISNFLKDRIALNKESGADIRDILVYFVGHGGITKDSSIFYLAIRHTEKDYEKATSIAIDDLAERLKKDARFQRRILVLDCCFAAAAVRFFQGPAPTVLLREKTIAAFEEKDQGEGFPSRGTSFLGSSGKDVASVILPDETSTMFTSAFLSVLRTGDPFQKRELLPLRTVHRLTIDLLSKQYGDNFPRPELHSPDQTEGKVEDVPFFPNPAVKAIKAPQSREVLSVQGVVENKEQETSQDQVGDEEHDRLTAQRDGKVTSAGQEELPTVASPTEPPAPVYTQRPPRQPISAQSSPSIGTYPQQPDQVLQGAWALLLGYGLILILVLATVVYVIFANYATIVKGFTAVLGLGAAIVIGHNLLRTAGRILERTVSVGTSRLREVARYLVTLGVWPLLLGIGFLLIVVLLILFFH
jgi:hypothetical protein